MRISIGNPDDFESQIRRNSTLPRVRSNKRQIPWKSSPADRRTGNMDGVQSTNVESERRILSCFESGGRQFHDIAIVSMLLKPPNDHGI